MPNNKNQSEQLKSRTDISEDEIELIDLIRILGKWRYLIIGGTLVCALVAAVISYNLKKIYRIETVFSPGILRIENNKKIFIDSTKNIKALIEHGTLNNEILSKLEDKNSVSVPGSLSFKVKLLPNSDMIKVMYKTADIDQGLRIVNLMKDILLVKYSRPIKYFQNEIEMAIKLKNAEQEKLLLTKHSIKKKIGNFEKRIEDLKSEIEVIKNNTDNLIRDRQQFLSKPRAENEILTALVYSNTIQQNMSLVNQYRDQLITYEIKLEIEKQDLAESEQNFIINNEIKSLEYKRDSITNIQILKPPSNSPSQVGPKKKRIVILAALVGLFSMLILSFLLEYIAKYKAKWRLPNSE
jgi:LPS O-antigen subunit length determinant protein (WzzB/FepE family)